MALTPMSVSARLEVNRSKKFHISVREILADFLMFFGHRRPDDGPIFFKN